MSACNICVKSLNQRLIAKLRIFPLSTVAIFHVLCEKSAIFFVQDNSCLSRAQLVFAPL